MSAGAITARTGARTFVLAEGFALLALVLVDLLLRAHVPVELSHVPNGWTLAVLWVAALLLLQRRMPLVLVAALLLGVGAALELRVVPPLLGGSTRAALAAVELAVHAVHAIAAVIVLPVAIFVIRKRPESGALAAALTYARFTCAAGLLVAVLVSWSA